MFTTRQLIQSVFVAATVAATAPVHADASFATGGYARDVLSDASAFAVGGSLRVAEYPWDNGGYKSDGGFAPADALIVAGYPWDNGGYKSDGWRSPELRG